MRPSPHVESDRATGPSAHPTVRRRVWSAVDRFGEEHLSTIARLCIVAVVWFPLWAVNRQMAAVEWPRPEVEPSTLLWFAVFAALIALFHKLRGPEVRGRAKLIWDGLTLAFASALVLAALDAAHQTL